MFFHRWHYIDTQYIDTQYIETFSNNSNKLYVLFAMHAMIYIPGAKFVRFTITEYIDSLGSPFVDIVKR